MKHFVTQYLCRLILGISLILTLVFACSTFPPAIEAQDFKSIVGKWEGWGQQGNGIKLNVKLTVLGDGNWQMRMSLSYYNSGNVFYGTAMLTEGKFRFDTPVMKGLSGYCTLHYWQNENWLVYFSDDGRFRAELKHGFF